MASEPDGHVLDRHSARMPPPPHAGGRLARRGTRSAGRGSGGCSRQASAGRATTPARLRCREGRWRLDSLGRKYRARGSGEWLMLQPRHPGVFLRNDPQFSPRLDGRDLRQDESGVRRIGDTLGNLEVVDVVLRIVATAAESTHGYEVRVHAAAAYGIHELREGLRAGRSVPERRRDVDDGTAHEIHCPSAKRTVTTTSTGTHTTRYVIRNHLRLVIHSPIIIQTGASTTAVRGTE